MARVRGPDGRWRVVDMVDPYPTFTGAGWADDPQWDAHAVYFVLDSDRSALMGPEGFAGRLAYDDKGVRDAEVCNVSNSNGDVCRMPIGHKGKHVPFSGELIACTGIFVEAIADG